MRTIRLVHYTTIDGVEYPPNAIVTVDANTASQLVSAFRAVYVDSGPADSGPTDPYPQYVTSDELEARLATVNGGTVLAPVATSGSYTDLVNKPVIPTTAAEIGAASSQEIELASVADRDRNNHTGQQPSSTISDFQEAVQDEVANFLGVSGAAITKTYDDATNTLILTVSAAASEGGTGTVDLEAMEDAIGASVIGLGNITATYTDNGDTGRGTLVITTTATQNSTDAQLRDRGTHTGTQSADTITDGITKKAFLATERTKLAGVQDGATANAPDADLRDRATHTGTQPIGSVEGLQEQLDLFIATPGVRTVNDDPGPEVSITLQNLPDTDVPIAEFSEDGTQVITPGPTVGDLWQVLPSGLHGPAPMPAHRHDDLYAPIGWIAPGTLFGQIVERGQAAPGTAPAGWLIIDKNNPSRLIYQVVETVASAGTNYSIIDPRDVQVTILNLDAADPGCDLVFPGKVPGSEFTLSLRQDSVGGRKVLWPASTILTWEGIPGVAPTLQTAPFAEDRLTFECVDGEKWTLKSHQVYAGSASGAGPTPEWIAAFFNTSGLDSQATTVPVTYPAVAGDDVGLLHVFVNGGTAQNLDTAALATAGWELLAGPVANSDTSLNARGWLFKKLFDGTEDGTVLNVNLVSGSSTRFVVTGSTFRGVDYDAVTVSDALRTGAVTVSIGVPGITPPVNNTLLVNLAGLRYGAIVGACTMTPSDGWDERVDHNEGRPTDGSSIQYGGFIQTKPLTGQGNTAQDATTATADPKSMYVSWTVALPPPMT